MTSSTLKLLVTLALSACAVAGLSLLAISIASGGFTDEDGLRLEKAEIWEREEREAREALTRPIPTLRSDYDFYYPTKPPPTIETGLEELPQGFFAYMFQNGWTDYVDGTPTSVLAGWDRRDRSQGVLVAWSGDPRDYPNGHTWYLSEYGSGPLRIESVDGLRFNLSSERGETYTFDFATRELTRDGLGTPTPATETPAPAGILTTENPPEP
jgi:hypothetical protein